MTSAKDYADFSGTLEGCVLESHLDKLPEPDTLYIFMTRGERKIANEMSKAFGGFRRVVIDVDGEQHEFGADSLIQMLEDYEDAQGMSNYTKLFGTPERAARVIVALNNCRVTDCIDCWARGACKYYGDGDDYDALLEWLKSEVRDD